MTQYTDNFDAADGTQLLTSGRGWTLLHGTSTNLVANSNRLRALAAFAAVWTAAGTSIGKSLSRATYKAADTNFGYQNAGPGVRLSTSNGTGYVTLASKPNNNHGLYRKTSTTALQLLGSGTGLVADDIFDCYADGSAISAWRNGVKTIGPVTDTNYSTGGIGMANHANVSAYSYWDNWVGDDFVVTTSPRRFSALPFPIGV